MDRAVGEAHRMGLVMARRPRPSTSAHCVEAPRSSLASIGMPSASSARATRLPSLQQGRRRFTIGQQTGDHGGHLSADPQRAFHIFLSYRREGNAIHAGRLHDFLVRGVADDPGFADDQIFMDIDTIAPGDDFREVIAEAVAKCDVLLAVIGREWTTVKDERGRRRLINAADFVRLEVEAALKREIPVVPVLVDDATMPKKSELPKSIADLAFRNAVVLSDSRWRDDVGRLLTSLKKREKAKAAAVTKSEPGSRKRATASSKSGTSRPKPAKDTSASKKKSSPTNRARTSASKPQAPTKQTPERQSYKPTDQQLPSPSFQAPRKPVVSQVWAVGNVFDGRVEEIGEGGAKVRLNNPPVVKPTYATLPGERVLGLAATPTLRVGDVLLKPGDVIRVKIEQNRQVLWGDRKKTVSFIRTMPPGTSLGLAPL